MSLTIFTSRQSSGINPAREHLLNQIVNCYKKTKFNKRRKIYVLTPKQDTYQVERELINLVGDGGLLGIKITDFESFIQDFIREEFPQLNYVDIHGQLMILQKALLNIEEDLGIYRLSIQEPNFKNIVLDEISLLKQAQLDPEKIENGLEKINDNLLKNKLKDISLILEEFNKLLGSEHFDESDLNSLALNLIHKTDFLDDLQIFCLDENSINYSQILFLINIAKIVKRIEIAINTDRNPVVPDNSAYQIPNQIINTFIQLGKEYGVKINIQDFPIEKQKSSLDYLASELFSYNPKRFSKKPVNVSLFQAKDSWDEVKQVAQNILKDYLNGISFSEIAVASNSSSDYDSAIRRIFTQYGIPYFVDENHKIIDNQFIQTILSALEIINNNFNRSDILNYIKSEFSGLNPEESDLLENYIIEAGIRPFEWKKPFKRVPRAWGLEKDEFDKNDLIIQLQNRILSNLEPFLTIGKKKLNVSEFIKLIQEFLLNTNCEARLEEVAEIVSKQDEQELSSRYRQIWNIFQEILNQLDNVLGSEKMNLDEFISILRSGISSYDIGVIPEDSEAVIISSLERTRLPETKNLYFLGLNEDLVPLKKADNSILTDYDKDQLKKSYNISNQLIDNKEFNRQLEENNFLSLISKASNKVFFTYHLYTTSGDRVFPSRYVDILFKIFGSQILKKPTKFFDLLTPERADVILENFINDSDYHIVKKILNEWFEENPDRKNIVKTLPIKPNDDLGEVDAHRLFQIFDDKNRVSISRLENYANCPFKHFLDYGIKIHDREEYKVRSFDTGIFIHEIYERFLSSLLDKEKNNEKFHENVNYLLDNPDSFEQRFEEIFSKVLEDLEESNRYKHTATSRNLIKKVKRICRLATRIMLEQFRYSKFKPVEFEKYFTDKREDGIIIEGRIDRVDIKEDSENPEVRVVDYKTSKRTINYIDLLIGRSLQLAVYLNEITQNYPDKFNPKGSYYFTTKQDNLKFSDSLYSDIVKKSKMNGINLTSKDDEKEIVSGKSEYSPNKLEKEEMELILEHASSLVKSLTDSLSSGNIEINPIYLEADDNSCRFCNNKDICKFNINNSEFNFKNVRRVKKDEFFEKVKEENTNE